MFACTLGAPSALCRLVLVGEIVALLRLVDTISSVTAKEKLLERAPLWTEEQAERALRTVKGDLVEDWGDVRTQGATLVEQADARLWQREREAGDSW